MWRLVPQQHGRGLGWGVGYGLHDPPPPGPGGCPVPQDSQSFLGRVPPQEMQDILFFSFYYFT